MTHESLPVYVEVIDGEVLPSYTGVNAPSFREPGETEPELDAIVADELVVQKPVTPSTSAAGYSVPSAQALIRQPRFYTPRERDEDDTPSADNRDLYNR